MEKCLKIKFLNGNLYAVPARIIAEKRSDSYAEIDGYEIGSNEWEAEVQYALNDEYEIYDWASNNMDWSELEPYAKRIEEEQDLNLENDWFNAEMKISGECEDPEEDE